PCRHEIDPLPAPPARTDLIPRTQQKAVRAPKPARPRPHPRSRPRPRPRPRSRPRALHRCVIGVLSTENPDHATVEPPNAPKLPPRASPRVGGLVSECAGPALTLTRLSLSHGACAGTRWLLGTVLALVARGHVVPREHARCGVPPQVQAAGRQPRSTRAS